MNESSTEKALRLFRSKGGILRTKEAIRLGIHPRTLYALRDAGDLEPISRGVFRLADLPPLSNPDLATVFVRVPDAVLCLISALSFHDMTTQIPHEVYIALKRGTEPPRIDHPPVRVFWFTGKAFSEGVETHQLDGINLRVFSAAKTVADCFKYRNKIGLDVAIEALKSYFHDQKGGPEDIMEYSRFTRTSRIIRPYLEALL